MKDRIVIIVIIMVLSGAAFSLLFLSKKEIVDKDDTIEINKEDSEDHDNVHNVRELIYDTERSKDCVMDVSYIKDGTDKPLILCVHGGYYSSGDKKDMNSYLSELAPSGYVVASVNYPLLPNCTIVQQIDYVVKAVDYLVDFSDIYEIDTKHINILGFSSGAQIAVTAAEVIVQRTGNKFELDTVIDISGPTDYRYLIEESGGEAQVSAAIIDGNTDADIMEELNKIDCTDNISEKLTNVLIIHGERDKTVPVAVSERFYESLIEAGVESNLKIVGSMGHTTNTEIVIPIIESYLNRGN